MHIFFQDKPSLWSRVQRSKDYKERHEKTELENFYAGDSGQLASLLLSESGANGFSEDQKEKSNFLQRLMAISLRRKYMEHLDFFSSFYYWFCLWPVHCACFKLRFAWSGLKFLPVWYHQKSTSSTNVLNLFLFCFQEKILIIHQAGDVDRRRCATKREWV